MESSYQKTTRDTVIVAVFNIVSFLIGMVQLPLITKTLPVSEYGIWAQVNVTVGLYLPLASLGITGALIRYLAAEKKREEIQEQFYSVVSIVLLFNLVAAAAIFVGFAVPLATTFFDGAVQIVRITGLLVLLTSVSGVYLELVRTFRQLMKYCLFLFAEDISRVGAIVYLVLTGHGVLSIVLAVAAIKIIVLAVLFFTVKSEIGLKRPHFTRIKEYLRFGLPLLPKGMSYVMVLSGDRYVISFFLGMAAVGIYAAAYGIGSLIYAYVGVLTLPLQATLSHLYDEGRMEEVKNHLSYSVKYFLALTIPFVFGAVVLEQPLLTFLTTSEIATQGRFVLPLAALATLALGIHNIIYHVLLLTRKTAIMGITWMGAAVLNVGLNILVIPRIGIIGAAITTLFVFILVTVVTSYYALKDIAFRTDWYFIIKSVFASAIMSAVVWWMHPQGIYVVIAVLLGAAVYGLAIFLMKGFSREEISLFRGLLRRSPPPAITEREISK